MKHIMILLAFMAASTPAAVAEQPVQSAASVEDGDVLVLSCNGPEACPAIRMASVESGAARASHSDSWIARSIRIEPVAGGFVVDGMIPEPLEVRLVSYLSDTANTAQTTSLVTDSTMLGLWTGGRVMYAYDCETSCAVIVQTRGQGEVLRAEAL